MYRLYACSLCDHIRSGPSGDGAHWPCACSGNRWVAHRRLSPSAALLVRSMRRAVNRWPRKSR
jgi:hypothetical protein